MKKYSMRSISAAASMATVLLFGVQAHAQNTGAATSSPPAGSTNKLDAPVPEPKGGAPKRMGAEANNSSGNPAAQTATMTPGTTNPKDNVSPAPGGGKAKSVEDRTAARMAKDEKTPDKAAKRAKRKAPEDDASLTKPGSTQ